MGDGGVGLSEFVIIDDISIMSFLLSFCFKTESGQWGVGMDQTRTKTKGFQVSD